MRTGASVTGRRVAASLAVTLAALATLFAAPSAGAQAPEPDCVGLVVDTGEGEPETNCVPFEEDLTGFEVLERAGHELTFGQNGFLCQIDRHPDECATDNTHFWAYYHRAPDAPDTEWGFSNAGGGQYVVHPGETEGWAYHNGGEQTPEAVPYATLQDAAEEPETTPPDQNQAATEDDEDSGVPWLVLGVILVVVVLAGAIARTTMARRRG